MLDFFKHIRLYLAGKWGLKRRVLAGPVPEAKYGLSIDTNGYISGIISYVDDFQTLRWDDGHNRLRAEIARLKRNKKKHSHLQKELDALIGRGADTQTNNGDDQ